MGDIREYRGFVLDRFQIDAICHIKSGNSVVVSAPTGSGKTLIAEYLIDIGLKQGARIVYTAPIKALSNQKYKQFCEQYGKDKIGILTGDVQINHGAPILIMTTEIYRNMVLARDPLVDEVKYVVFDEIHFISDFERGSVWEESIIFSPEHIRFLCLSATIPNADELAGWIESIKKHSVKVIVHQTRAVPLYHYVFDSEIGMTTVQKLKRYYKEVRQPRRSRRLSRRQGGGGKKHLDLIRELYGSGELPCIYFVFSRAATKLKARQTMKIFSFLNADERIQVSRFVRKKLSQTDPQILELRTTNILRETLSKGIGFHHAGLIPQQKEIVEQLFEQGLVKVLYATETFAVGINMPAKVVCFDSLRKFDGIHHRYLTSQEYFQLAGRAGRRGIDKMGKAVAVVEPRFDDMSKIFRITTTESEPIRSRFRLSYNSVLNMLHHHTDEEIEILLRSNFYYFQKYAGSKRDAYELIRRNFRNKKRILEKYGYLKDRELTAKGGFATKIYMEELLVTETFFEPFYKNLNEFQILLLITAIIYEPGRRDTFKFKLNNRDMKMLRRKIRSSRFVKRTLKTERIEKLADIVWQWSHKCSFVSLLERTNLTEGDIIRLFRRVIDLASQIKKGSGDPFLHDRINNAIKMIDREFVAVVF